MYSNRGTDTVTDWNINSTSPRTERYKYFLLAFFCIWIFRVSICSRCYINEAEMASVLARLFIPLPQNETQKHKRLPEPNLNFDTSNCFKNSPSQQILAVHSCLLCILCETLPDSCYLSTRSSFVVIENFVLSWPPGALWPRGSCGSAAGNLLGVYPVWSLRGWEFPRPLPFSSMVPPPSFQTLGMVSCFEWSLSATQKQSCVLLLLMIISSTPTSPDTPLDSHYRHL